MRSLFKGTFIQTPAEETEGALQLGPERARVFIDLSAEEKERYKADIRATNILLQALREDTATKRISDKRTKNQAKTDKTKHGMEKHGKDKVKSKPSQQKSKPKSTPGCVSGENSKNRSQKPKLPKVGPPVPT
ncbi:hypothetical protein Tco_0265574 [Tanacetum coccineum]